MWNASFKLTSECGVSICCVGFASFDVVCDELNDCVWNVCSNFLISVCMFIFSKALLICCCCSPFSPCSFQSGSPASR